VPVICANSRIKWYINAIRTIKQLPVRKSFALTALYWSTRITSLIIFKKAMLGGAHTFEKYAGAKIVAQDGKRCIQFSKWIPIFLFTAT